MFGYENNEHFDHEAMSDLLVSLMVLFEANGVTLSLLPLREKGQG